MCNHPEPTQAVHILRLQPRIPIPDYLRGEIQAKLAYVDEWIAQARLQPEEIELHLALPAGATHMPSERQAELEEKVQRVIVSMAQGAYKPKVQVLEDHLDRPVPYHADPLPELMQRGQVYQEGQGIFALGPLVAQLVEYFESQFLDLAASFGALPYRFPTLIPAAYLERVNYFRSFPHSLTFATHLREDLDVIDAFAQQAAVEPQGLSTTMESFARIQALLSPAVCYHLYFALADQRVPNDGYVATAVGNCFRYEAINLTSLERMWNFTMREVILVGSKDFVLDNRELGRQRMEQVFARLGLAYRVESANDPFFVGEFRKQTAFQSAFQLKYEIRAALPYKGSTLAVGSYNHHQDFFGRSLNITLADGSPAHTGCIAFGLERIALAFLAQFGLKPENWPEEVRSHVRRSLPGAGA